MPLPPSPRLGLALPDLTDRFSTADLRSNWQKVDAAPGTFICTSTTRPTGWGANQAGRRIIETNTKLEWMWTGTGWVRLSGGTGALKTSGGADALVQRTTTFDTASDSYVKVVGISNVVVPAGNRPLMYVATWQQADNDSGIGVACIARNATAGGGPVLGRTFIAQSPGSTGNGGSIVAFERGGLPANTYDFSIQLRTGGSGRVYMYADATTPIQLSIIEL